ncbi:acyltransferase family protein [Gilvimarinus sp. F26214L]|uniref:acyltransferase family protein n=1 Tax=Gilvimarinus sp. DZF01 TaxID=3461371 RepID=UPI0040454019
MNNKRNDHIDNIKGILIFCVVVGHAIEPLIARSDLSAWLYWFLYIFHMPLFIAVSGYLSASHHGEKEHIGILSGLVIPYIVFELAYTTLDSVLTGGSWKLLCSGLTGFSGIFLR